MSVKTFNPVAGRITLSAERRFYAGFTVAMTLAVIFGFARTFFLRPWFPEWVAAHAAPEMIFYVHGVFFFSWILLLVWQTFLVSARRVDLHRRIGVFGGILAAIIVPLGIVAALVAARRPTGFKDVPISPLEFLIVPVTDVLLFAVFVTFAFLKRKNTQSHKRFMLLTSIALVDAAVARWPFAIMTAVLPLGFAMTDVFVDLFLIPIIVWDFVSRGRIHPVTLWSGIGLILSQPLRVLVSGTQTWLSFAQWAVGLLG